MMCHIGKQLRKICVKCKKIYKQMLNLSVHFIPYEHSDVQNNHINTILYK